MAQVQFAGSWFSTLGQAAAAWAETALPDASVFGADENPGSAATDPRAAAQTRVARPVRGGTRGHDGGVRPEALTPFPRLHPRV